MGMLIHMYPYKYMWMSHLLVVAFPEAADLEVGLRDHHRGHLQYI